LIAKLFKGSLWHRIGRSGFDMLRLHDPLGSIHILDVVRRYAAAFGRENTGDAVGPAISRTKGFLQTDKLADMKCGVHVTLPTAVAGIDIAS
jgi:hypothetical protein